MKSKYVDEALVYFLRGKSYIIIDWLTLNTSVKYFVKAESSCLRKTCGVLVSNSARNTKLLKCSFGF